MNLVFLLPLAATVVVYLQALHGGFLFDDFSNIVENTSVHLTSLSVSGLGACLEGVSAGPLGRPVSVLSFALTHWAFGLDPYAFKAINLAIHLINGLLVGRLISLLLKQEFSWQFSESARIWLPLWVAGAWLLHPIHFVAISMAVQRMTLLAAMFTLLALISHLKAVRSPERSLLKWAWALLAWTVCWPLAVLSKETGLLFPLFAMLIAFFAGDRVRSGTREKSQPYSFLAGAIALVAIGMYWRIGLSWVDAGYSVRDFTMYERLLTQSRVLWFYLRQIILPDHDSFALYLDWFTISRGLFQPESTFLSILAWVGAIAAAIKYRSRQPALAFGLAWFLVGHSMESTFIPLEIAHEHRNYLPALGCILAVGVLGSQVFAQLNFQQSKTVPFVVSIGVLFALAALTGMRSAQMSNPLIGAQIEATRHDLSARANYVAASTLIRAGYGDGDDPMGGKNVRYYFEQAERSDNGFKLGYFGLIVWACSSGRSVERVWLDDFAERLESTAFAYGHFSLPQALVKTFTSMPDCLPRNDVLKLFEAGARNPRLRSGVRSRFLEAAADYELLISHDAIAAREYYLRSISFDTGNVRLKNKIEGLSSQ